MYSIVVKATIPKMNQKKVRLAMKSVVSYSDQTQIQLCNSLHSDDTVTIYAYHTTIYIIMFFKHNASFFYQKTIINRFFF